MSFETWISIGGALIVPLLILYMRFKLTQADRAADERRKERDAQILEDKKTRDEKDKENDRVHTELRRYIERVNQELYTTRLEISSTYVTQMMMKDFKLEVIRAVEKLETKLDQSLENQRRHDK